jgi:hypothetical protein
MNRKNKFVIVSILTPLTFSIYYDVLQKEYAINKLDTYISNEGDSTKKFF